MLSRNDYAKRIRKIEIFSSLFMIIGALVAIIFGWGYIGLLIIFGIFIGVQVSTYRIIKRCACPKCKNVDIFEKRYGFTYKCKDYCPNCHTALKPDQKIISPK